MSSKQQGFKIVIHSKIGNDRTKDNSSVETKDSSSADTVERVDTKTDGKDTDAADRKRKRSDKETISIHGQLKKWNRKTAELKLDDEFATDDFSDLTQMACLLCHRRFKSKEEINKHIERSELHKNNLEDETCVKKGRERMQRAKQVDEVPENNTTDPSKYRNRAAERRQVYGQPEKPPPLSSGHRRRPGATAVRSKPASESVSATASISKPLANDNVGSKMLQQMGWRHGEGLGKDGSGIVDPITAERYAQGAGLGSIHAKSSIQALNGTESYKERVKEMTQRRYDEINKPKQQ